MGRGEHFVVMFVGAPLWVKSRHRRSADKCPLSPPKADIGTQSWNVRFVPKADIMRCRKIPAI